MGKKHLMEKTKLKFDEKRIKQFQKDFISITIHTTGPNPSEDQITKIAAVKYHKCKEKQSYFEEFKNDNEDMVVYHLQDFLEDALKGKVPVYITGYFYDIDFITNLLEKHQVKGELKYVTFTCFNRKYIKHIDDFTEMFNKARVEYENNSLGNAKAYGATIVKMIKDL